MWYLCGERQISISSMICSCFNCCRILISRIAVMGNCKYNTFCYFSEKCNKDLSFSFTYLIKTYPLILVSYNYFLYRKELFWICGRFGLSHFPENKRHFKYWRWNRYLFIIIMLNNMYSLQNLPITSLTNIHNKIVFRYYFTKRKIAVFLYNFAFAFYPFCLIFIKTSNF